MQKKKKKEGDGTEEGKGGRQREKDEERRVREAGREIQTERKKKRKRKGRGGLKERGGEKHSAAGFGVVECEGKFRDMLLRMPPKGATEIQAKRAFK